MKLFLLAFFHVPLDRFRAHVSSSTDIVAFRPQGRVLSPGLAAKALKLFFQPARRNPFEGTDNSSRRKLRRCAYIQMHVVGHDLNCQYLKTVLCGDFCQMLLQPRLDRANQNLFAIARYPDQMVVDSIRAV